jgi:hypothetical protein
MRLKLSDHDSLNNNNSCYKFSNGKTVWVNIPEPVDDHSVYRNYRLKPFGKNQDLISGIKILRILQAGGLSLIETSVKSKKYDYRANPEKLFHKTFGATRSSYSTSDE